MRRGGGSFGGGVLAMGNREGARRNHGPSLNEAPDCAHKLETVARANKVKRDSNFLYPTVLYLASKEVDVHVLGYVARRARLQSGSE